MTEDSEDVFESFFEDKCPYNVRDFYQNFCLLIIVEKPLFLKLNHKVFKILENPFIL
jgi:hypothetical protein